MSRELDELNNLVSGLRRRTPARIGGSAATRRCAWKHQSTVTGAGNFTVPSCEGRVALVARGAGGGGAGCSAWALATSYYSVSSGGAVSANILNYLAGGGGGAGGWILAEFDVTAGEIIAYSVGAGGSGATGANDGSAGGATTVTVDGMTITAGGGYGGRYYISTTAHDGGGPASSAVTTRNCTHIPIEGCNGEGPLTFIHTTSLPAANARYPAGGKGPGGKGGFGSIATAVAGGNGGAGSLVFYW